ncbi:hypothetical protein [Bifidobacterium avesanii]|uniref:Uncharacterized protein n=1 Tax=Bifidobacterium avesanii TaxID=1798157 RepID=A0A7K3TEU0_9BIFI|nr:hypothetical protein [Bifidobacterium avesanii]NEG77601.1 hypothetical protein [Bifidobacterium avesanii]
MRKIWRPLPLMGVAAVCMVTWLFIVGNTPLGAYTDPDNDPVTLSTRYGLTVEQAKPALQREYDEAVAQFDRDVASVPAARARGVVDARSYEAWDAGLPSTIGESDWELIVQLGELPSYRTMSQASSLLSQIDESPGHFESSLRQYAAMALGFRNEPRDPLPALAARRVERIAAQYDARSMLDLNIEDAVSSSGPPLFAAVAVGAILLTMSTLTQDRQTGMRRLQWSSRAGRAVMGTQAVAIGLSSALLSAVIAGLWAGWTAHRVWPCLNMPLLSYDPPLLWFDWTVAQYIAAVVLTAVPVGAASGLLAAWIVRARPNMIRLLIAVIPVGAVIAFIAGRLLGVNLYMLRNPLSRFVTVPGVEPGVALIGLALGVALWAFSVRRLRRRELSD